MPLLKASMLKVLVAIITSNYFSGIEIKTAEEAAPSSDAFSVNTFEKTDAIIPF